VVTGFVEVRDTLGGAIKRVLPDMNVYNHVPRSLVPPAAIVRPTPNSSIDYEQMYSSSQADWMWTLMLVIGQIDDEWAQDQMGELITPRGDMIRAINDVVFVDPNSGSQTGWAKALRGGISQMNFGKALYSYAEITVRVTV
jgi:hypothetical protein